MKNLILFLFLAASAFGAGQTTIFHVDASTRGTEIANMITTLNSAPYNIPQYEVALQLASTATFPYPPSVANGQIPYVVSVEAAPNDTLLIVKYMPKPTNPQYLVVPIEQITAIVYSLLPISQTATTSNYLTNITPFLFINPSLRASDIQSVVTSLMAPPYKAQSSTIALYTTLNGPYYPGFSNGMIYKVQAVTQISVGDSLLLVTYQAPPYDIQGTVVVAAEQVLGIVYYPTYPVTP